MSKILILTDVEHVYYNGQFFGYGPYIKEINLWIKNHQEVCVLAPLHQRDKVPTAIELGIQGENVEFVPIYHLNFSGFLTALNSLISIPQTLKKIFRQVRRADLVHLRNPSHAAFLGLLVLLFFRKKKVIAKYAGNWDPKSKQPLSYELHRKLLNNTILYPSMKVMVYGEFDHSSKNILPFFTASYSKKEIKEIPERTFSEGINLIFVGALFREKHPEKILQVTRRLMDEDIPVCTVICGNGPEMLSLKELSFTLEIDNNVKFLGNVSSETVKNEFIKAHFLIFISQSEGWPKVVAESMFWGCVPFTSNVSCVPQMVGEREERGILINQNEIEISEKILFFLRNPDVYYKVSLNAMEWSRNYTMEKFDEALRELNESTANN